MSTEPTFTIELPVRLASRLESSCGHMISRQEKRLRQAISAGKADGLINSLTEYLEQSKELFRLVESTTGPILRG